ncbi:helix-turn-helix transcriptional regulator [Vibrio comitans]|uniref:HTH luxR-type domain-containing protein n=1 Tax=Vibrio comitans NBRC 102076 TaxID=1219078 RepID=A0A4Y3IPT1_9VIBR|nr:response regulator transcription factor [Vibrio comitans]GEA60848.1 hypothetical protein VCO01S_20410 [Vibrio comitans NBRC 102076]
MMHKYACGHVVTRSKEFANATLAILQHAFPRIEFTSSTHLSECYCAHQGGGKRCLYLIDIKTVSNPIREGINPVHETSDWVALNVDEVGYDCATWILGGFAGVIMKKYCLEQLVSAVVMIEQGELWYSRRDLSRLAKAYVADEFDPHAAADDFAESHALTPKEKRVCVMMLKGLNNPQIAESANVSVNTVKTHASNILRKINVHSRAELIAIAVKQTTNSPQNRPVFES